MVMARSIRGRCAAVAHVRGCVLLGVLAAMAAVTGCGKSDGLVPVSGTVTLDGSPLEKAVVTFHPQAGAKGNGSGATTDAAGKFTLMSPQGKKGILPGEYAVTVSRRELTPKAEKMVAEMQAQGQAPALTDSDSKEALPLPYTKPETSPLKQSVGAKGAADVTLQLDSSLKPAKPGR